MAWREHENSKAAKSPIPPDKPASQRTPRRQKLLEKLGRLFEAALTRDSRQTTSIASLYRPFGVHKRLQNLSSLRPDVPMETGSSHTRNRRPHRSSLWLLPDETL